MIVNLCDTRCERREQNIAVTVFLIKMMITPDTHMIVMMMTITAEIQKPAYVFCLLALDGVRT
jgi:hypothetical protein